MTTDTTKKKPTKERQKQLNLSKLAAALQEANKAAAAVPEIKLEDINLINLHSSLAKAAAMVATDINVPAGLLKLSASLSANKPAKSKAA